MGKIAQEKSDFQIITNDNPRNEDPKKIRNEIIKNIKFTNYFNIGNRTQAIKTAVLKAEPGEIILVAGKGHEKEQIYKNKIISISDSQIIKRLKIKIKRLSNINFTFLQNTSCSGSNVGTSPSSFNKSVY